ncbi:MAG: NAD-dependent epimerase/dehydratase family protein, partial [Paracoccaceae bacterium]|nr:NAD-dependent epimerase/dehydratase family protein [Paracoccaceae bacterium]
HADAIKATPDAQLVAVCDQSKGAAEDLARAHGVQAFGSVDDMIAAGLCDAVHILTPPSSHRDLTLQCLRAGLHVLVEKPVALSGDEADQMRAAAADAGKVLAAGHNFLGLPSYERLKVMMQGGELGRVSSVQINWALPLAPLRSGPFGLWLLREPRNLLLELGPHLYAFAVDLLGTPEVLHLDLGQPVDLSGGGTRHQSWRVLARAGDIDLSFNIALVEVMDDRSVTVRGSSAIARLDYAADTLVVARDNTADLVLNPFLRQMSLTGQNLREGVVNAARQLSSLNQKSPYGISFRTAVGAFYDATNGKTPLDARFDFTSATAVMRAIDATLDHMPALPAAPAKPKGTPKPTVMVIGGTGFIGRNLTRMLVARGHDVRVLSRGRTGPFDDIADHVETVPVSLRDLEGLTAAMQGIDAVFNLAKSMDKTWDAALENDVGTALRVAEAAMAAGVKRLIYTGTIASYDMSDPYRTITEDTGFGADMSDRNLYARSKAECEAQLMRMHRDRGLPLVIARPGIVVGHGGPLQHWGIGRWHGAGAVRIWGHGRNILPFVLADDVSDGLIRMMDNPDAVGRSFNLVGDPMMSARDYFDAIHQALGARITDKPGNLHAMWLADGVKYILKRHALGRKGAVRPSLADWKSRAHFSKFDNSRTKAVLGWVPEADRKAFITRGIVQANLFGL